jgi:hypothetical protein
MSWTRLPPADGPVVVELKEEQFAALGELAGRFGRRLLPAVDGAAVDRGHTQATRARDSATYTTDRNA